MRQIAVDLEFDDETGFPSFFVTEDGKMKLPYAKVEMADWKDAMGQADAIINLSCRLKDDDEIVVLFDGSDTIIYALMSDFTQV